MSRARTVIVGGGAAGFFLAVDLAEQCPGMDITILESAQRTLRKVELSGGGRCNLTNTFDSVSSLKSVYPRGHNTMKRLLAAFGPEDAWRWFEDHGVPLVAQADGCVFPRSQDARTISTMLRREATRHGVSIVTGRRVTSLDDVAGYDYCCITTGGQPRTTGLDWMEQATEPPVPSLFSLAIADSALTALAGTVTPPPGISGGSQEPSVLLPGTKLRASGPLLITHWGLSGPAILRLSSYAARHLHDSGYQAPLVINWAGTTEAEATEAISATAQRGGNKHVASLPPLQITQRLWEYLATKAIGQRAATATWATLSAREQRRMASLITCDQYTITGRAPHRDEFVTCGGISLKAVDGNTLESRSHPGLFFAGEVLDIDGVTGGFNLQAAWTTAHAVATAIASKAHAAQSSAQQTETNNRND